MIETNKNFRLLNHKDAGKVKTNLVLESLVDATVEKRKLGFDRMGAPDLEIRQRSLKCGEQFEISVFNEQIPKIGSLVSADYIVEQADISFFTQASSFSGKPIGQIGIGPWGLT